MRTNIIKITDKGGDSRICRGSDVRISAYTGEDSHIAQYCNVFCYEKETDALKELRRFLAESSEHVQEAVRMEKAEASGGESRAIFELNLTDELRTRYFRGRYELLKDFFENISPEQFARDGKLKYVIEEYMESKCQAMVIDHEGKAVPIDRFVREYPEGTYYITDIARAKFIRNPQGLYL